LPKKKKKKKKKKGSLQGKNESKAAKKTNHGRTSEGRDKTGNGSRELRKGKMRKGPRGSLPHEKRSAKEKAGTTPKMKRKGAKSLPKTLPVKCFRRSEVGENEKTPKKISSAGPFRQGSRKKGGEKRGGGGGGRVEKSPRGF